MVIVGHNGSGKTTLLNLVFGDLHPDAGEMTLVEEGRSRPITRVARRDRATLMARVHQDPTTGTVAGLTLWENLRLASLSGGLASPFRFSSARKMRTRHGRLLESLNLSDKLEARASELSAGQKQMAALLLAWIRRPALLLLDEHTASLDARNARTCMERAVKLSKDSRTTVLAVTHDLSQALAFGDRLVVLRDGRIASDFPADTKAVLSLAELVDACGYRPKAPPAARCSA